MATLGQVVKKKVPRKAKKSRSSKGPVTPMSMMNQLGKASL